MCRNIRTLFNFEPPATEQEIREASLQFVRKLSGFTAPSKANEAAFQRAVRVNPCSFPTDSMSVGTGERRDTDVPAGSQWSQGRRSVASAASATVLIHSLTTASAPRDRVAEVVKAKARSAMRFGGKRPD
jgi:hypothetical protein